MVDFPTPVEAIDADPGAEDLQRPQPAAAARPRLGAAHAHPRPDPAAAAGGDGDAAASPTRHGRRRARSTGCARRLKAHPCHDCPDREDHARWAERWFKLDRDAATLRRRDRAAHQHRRAAVRPGLRGADGAGLPRRRHGHRARRATCGGSTPTWTWWPPSRCAAACGTAWTPSELAAALSVLVFEARRPDDASSPRLPGGAVRERDRPRRSGSGASWTRSSATTGSTSCASPTSGSRGRPTAGPRATSSTTCSHVTDLAAGDFVRWIKQLLDLAGQVADAAGPGELRETAREVVRRLNRGVVAYSSLTD